MKLIVPNRRFAVANGRFVTDAGGAPCCCGPPNPGCSCMWGWIGPGCREPFYGPGGPIPGSTCCKCGKRYRVRKSVRLRDVAQISGPVFVYGGPGLPDVPFERADGPFQGFELTFDGEWEVWCEDGIRFMAECLSAGGTARVWAWTQEHGAYSGTAELGCNVMRPELAINNGCPPSVRGLELEALFAGTAAVWDPPPPGPITGFQIGLARYRGYDSVPPGAPPDAHQCAGSRFYPVDHGDNGVPYMVALVVHDDVAFQWSGRQSCTHAVYSAFGTAGLWGYRPPAVPPPGHNQPQSVGSATWNLEATWDVEVLEECTSNPCGPPPATGACCGIFQVGFGSVGCIVTTAAVCGLRGGLYVGDGSTCATGTCPEIGACCRPDGSCVMTTKAACLVTGGIWHQGIQCRPFLCASPPVGACCLPNQSCVPLTQAQCTAQFGTWRGAGVACPPTGQCLNGYISACCISWNDGADHVRCFENVTCNECQAIAGSIVPPGTFPTVRCGIAAGQTCQDINCVPIGRPLIQPDRRIVLASTVPGGCAGCKDGGR